MKHLLLTTIAVVALVGCATTQQPEPTTAKAPDISIHEAAYTGNIEAVKQHLAAGTDVNAKASRGWTPLHSVATKEIAELLIANGANMNSKIELGKWKDQISLSLAIQNNQTETADLLRKHGAKTGEELKAEGK